MTIDPEATRYGLRWTYMRREDLASGQQPEASAEVPARRRAKLLWGVVLTVGIVLCIAFGFWKG